jgi:hypothetical protein
MSDATTRFGDPTNYTERYCGAEEAALLVAANRLDAAEAVLRAAIADALGRRDERHWLMLLEVLHLTGQRDAFDGIAARFEAAFETTAPAWGCAQPIRSAGTFALKGVVGTGHGDLEALTAFAGGHKTLVIDVSEVERIEFGFLLQLQVTLRAMASGGGRIIVANASEVVAVLLKLVAADKHAAIMRRRPAPKLAIAA